MSNLFVFSYYRCGFLDLQLCFLQLPPENFLQLKETEQHDKNIKKYINEEELMYIKHNVYSYVNVRVIKQN